MPSRATERFNLRATPEQAAKIRAAVEIGNERSLTDYILTSALTIADQRLMDRTSLGFDARAYNAFLEALDAPPTDLPRMRRLLSEPSVLEQQGPDVSSHQEAEATEREAGPDELATALYTHESRRRHDANVCRSRR